MNEKLRRVLLEFFPQAKGRGEPVPAEAQILAMADTYPQWPADADDVMEAWRPTRDHLGLQVRFGVHEPIPQMPNELWEPVRDRLAKPPPAAEPPPRHAEPVSLVDALGDVLIAWKNDMLTAHRGDPVLTAIKDKSHLRQIAQRNARTSEEIARLLPHAEGFQRLVPELVEVVARFHAARSESGAARVERTPAAAQPAAPAAPPANRAQPPTPVQESPAPAVSRAMHVAPPAEPVLPAALFEVDPDGFAPAPRAHGADQAPEMTVAVTETKGVFLAWRPPPDLDRVVLYRVVAMDRTLPWSPERGRPVAVISGTQVQDDAEFTSGVRYYSVWANTGPTIEQAMAAQPLAVARGHAIELVRNFDPREEAGSVVAQWNVWPEAERVHVYRVPLERAAMGRNNPQYRIQGERKNLNGFQDSTVEHGSAYLYQAQVEVLIDGQPVLSDPIEREVRVHAVLERVLDLEATLHGSENAPKFDLRWTQPLVGDVAIFRTEAEPPPSLGDEERTFDQIEQYGGLTPASRLPWPADVEDRIASVSDVPWPKDWARAHFTPVTVMGNRVAVGKTVTKVRVEQIVDADLHERVHEQLITFTWPNGATTIQVFQTPKGGATPSGPPEPGWELSRDRWEKEGGFRTPKPLVAKGCTVHLLPIAYHEGKAYPGTPSTLEYPGLVTIRYHVETRRAKGRNAGFLVVTLTSDIDMPTPPPFYLIANDERFPLESGDGRPLPVVPVGQDGREPQKIILPDTLGPHPRDQGWAVDLDAVFAESRSSWFYARLFASLPAEVLRRVAVLDPPLDTLIVRRA